MGLFSTTIHQHSHAPAYPQHIHNAPTVEQARYLDELRQQAREDAMKAVGVPGNVLAKAVAFRDMADRGYIIAFELNGRPYRVKVYTDEKQLMSATPHYAAQAVAEEIASQVTRSILEARQ